MMVIYQTTSVKISERKVGITYCTTCEIRDIELSGDISFFLTMVDSLLAAEGPIS